MNQYIAIRSPDAPSLWTIVDDRDRVCWRTGSLAKAAAVVEFLSDPRASSFDGIAAWYENRSDPLGDAIRNTEVTA